MTASFMFERISHHSCAFPLEEIKSIHGKSYYRFYQLKLRQSLTENRYHSEQKRSKVPCNDRRSYKDYMNHLRTKIKQQTQNDDHRNRSSSVLSVTNRRTKDAVTFTITSTTNTMTSTEYRPKSILKPKQSTVSTKHQRVTSAPANSQKVMRKKSPMKIPTIEIDYADDNLSKSNAHSYTQVSSSSQNSLHKNHRYAQQSFLNTIISHFNSYAPSNVSKWDLYRDYDEQMSASISPRVYQDFERIIL